MLHRLTFMTGRNAKQKKQFLTIDEYAFIHYGCILASPAWRLPEANINVREQRQK